MSQKVLLIADDQDDNRVIFSAVLTHHGYGVFLATDGREAVELAWAHSPRLILMDLKMPVMDGWEATRLLKADAATAHIPIVAVTAEDHRDSDLGLVPPVAATVHWADGGKP
jgi:two-component system, cell cycle response regulator DivK